MRVSNITEQTILSTQYSDDHQGTSSPINLGESLPCNLSSIDQNSNPARSRGVSDLSSDFNCI